VCELEDRLDVLREEASALQAQAENAMRSAEAEYCNAKAKSAELQALPADAGELRARVEVAVRRCRRRARKGGINVGCMIERGEDTQKILASKHSALARTVLCNGAHCCAAIVCYGCVAIPSGCFP
jgi:hypothetical protein